MFLIAGLIAAPLLVNLNGYKNELALTIKASTGLDPQINGSVSVSFIPRPSIIVTNVTVPNTKEGTSPNIISIESVEVGSSFQSLLSGKVDIKKVELIHPFLELEEYPNGKKNWDLVREAFKARDTSGKFQFPDKIGIKNGTVTVSSAGKKRTIDYITAEVSADSVNGPFGMEGNFSNNSHVIKFEGNVGELREGASAEFNMSSDSFSIGMKGKYSPNDDGKIQGSVNGRVTNLSGFVESIFESSSILSNVKSTEKMDLKGDFLISNSMVSFNNIDISSDSLKGKAVLEALFNLKVAETNLQWDATLNIEKIDFDKLLTEEAKPTTKGDTEIDYYASTMNSMTLSDFKFDMPQALSAMINFSIKEVTYNKQKIENLKIEADIFDGKAIINSVSADMPGKSSLRFVGNIENNGTRPILHGKAELSGASLREFAVWLQPDYSFIPEGEAGEYLLSGDVEVTPQRIDISNGAISVDKSLIEADVSIRPASTVPVVKAGIKIDNLDLDRYKFTDKIHENVADFIATASKTSLERSWLQLFGVKLDFTLDANDIVYNGYNIKNVVSSLSVSRGIFDLQRLLINSDSATFNLRTYINIAQENPRMDIVVRSSGFDTALFRPQKSETAKAEEKGEWSNKPFNFMGIARFEGRTSLAFKSFRHKNLLLENLVIDGETQRKIFTFKRAVADLYGGKAVVNGSFGISEDAPSLGISAVLSNVGADGLLKNFSDKYNISGGVFLSGTLKTVGKSPSAFITNMVADAKFSGRNIIFNNFDLEQIIRKSQSLYSVIDMDAVVKEASTTGTTLFDSIDGHLTTAGGILKATDFQLATRLSRGVFAGNVNLVNFDMNGVAKIVYKPEATKKVTLDMDMKGKLDDVVTNLNTKDLETYITDKGGKKAP
ncbi:MAG: putative assembly protein [Rickettsiaceae bacterium]|jgi:hypothetical protein|nr:putative assembly protein [Rickettsiaceae bacterium]